MGECNIIQETLYKDVDWFIINEIRGTDHKCRPQALVKPSDTFIPSDGQKSMTYAPIIHVLCLHPLPQQVWWEKNF